MIIEKSPQGVRKGYWWSAAEISLNNGYLQTAAFHYLYTDFGISSSITQDFLHTHTTEQNLQKTLVYIQIFSDLCISLEYQIKNTDYAYL